MTLYVCYGTFGPEWHSCGKAYKALRDAGYDPEVKRGLGWGLLPDALNVTPVRRDVKRRTGNTWLPVLITDDDETVQGSDQIAAWAHSHPAT